MTWRSRVAPVLSAVCFTWCIVIGFVIWFSPMRYSGISNGVPVVVDRQLAEVSGAGALPLVIPVFLAGLGTWGAWFGRRLVLAGSALLLVAFAVVAGFSIGGAYLPASGLQLLAAGLAAFLGSGRLEPAAA
jgi:hypothetical protein